MLVVAFYGRDGNADAYLEGHVYCDGNRIWTDTPTLEHVVGEDVRVPFRGWLRPEEDPRLWMECLKTTYHGSAFWATSAREVTSSPAGSAAGSS